MSLKISLQILLIDNDGADHQAFVQAANRCHLPISIRHTTDGEAAYEALHADSPLPIDVIVLDLDLPHRNAIDFLKTLRANRSHDHDDLAVFVLAASSVESEIEEATTYGIAGCVVKTENGDHLSYLISRISVYLEQAQRLSSH